MFVRPFRQSLVRPIHIVVALLFTLAATLTAGPTVSRAADGPIFGDSLANSWIDWSWGTTVDLGAKSPARGATSIAVKYDKGWSGFYLHTNNAITTTSSTVLRFWIHGGSSGNQRIKVMVRDAADRASATVDVLAQAGTWNAVEVSMGQLSFSGAVSGVVLQDASGTAQPVFYVDDITLGGPELTANPAMSYKVYLPKIAKGALPKLVEEPVVPTPTTPPAPSPTSPTLPTPSPIPTPMPVPPGEPIPGTVRIMPLGDSITEGVSGGFRNGLWNRLTADGYKLDYVGPRYDKWTQVPDKDHAGTPGFTTGGVIDNIDAWMNTYKPQIVLLLIGTNDLAWWMTESPDATAGRVGTIIDKIKATSPDTYILVGTITPMKGVAPPNNIDRNTLVNQYNAAVRKVVADRAAKGARTSIAETNAAVSLSDLYDEVHPNAAGHEKMAQVWYQAVKPLLSKP